jgi:hypothetical protein
MRACCAQIAASPDLRAIEAECQQGLWAGAMMRQFTGMLGTDMPVSDDLGCSAGMMAVQQAIAAQISASGGRAAYPSACRWQPAAGSTAP